MWLETERGPVIEPVTEDEVNRAFAKRPLGRWLMLSREEDWLEAVGDYPSSDWFHLLYYGPANEGGQATRERLTCDQAHHAFLEYLRGGNWRGDYSWSPWAPVKVRIPYEGEVGRFPLTGRLDDGTQFTAFDTGECASGVERRWVAVLHLFDSDGQHLHSESRIGGYDSDGMWVAWERTDEELSRLVVPILPRVRTLCDVYIKPFSVVLNGVRHGLVFREDYEAAIFYPQDVWFYFPWDTGDYDT